MAPRLDPQQVHLSGSARRHPGRPWLGGFPAGSAIEYALDFSADGRRVVAAVDHLAPTGVWDEETVATVWDLADPSKPYSR